MTTIIQIAEIAAIVAGIGLMSFFAAGLWMSATLRKFTKDHEQQSLL